MYVVAHVNCLQSVLLPNECLYAISAWSIWEHAETLQSARPCYLIIVHIECTLPKAVSTLLLLHAPRILCISVLFGSCCDDIIGIRVTIA